MCCDIWFLPKSKVQTGSHYYTPCCIFTHKCHCASAGPSSPVAELKGQTWGSASWDDLRHPLSQTLASFFTMLSGPWLPPSIPTIAPTLAPHSTLAHAGRTSPCGSKHCGKYQRQGLLEAMKKAQEQASERAKAASLIVRSEGCLTV